MLINRLPLKLREEIVSIGNGTHVIPDGVIAVTIQCSAGALTTNSSIEFPYMGLKLRSDMFRAGGGGHDYVIRNWYNIFLPNMWYPDMPRVVLIEQHITIVRWIYQV